LRLVDLRLRRNQVQIIIIMNVRDFNIALVLHGDGWLRLRMWLLLKINLISVLSLTGLLSLRGPRNFALQNLERNARAVNILHVVGALVKRVESAIASLRVITKSLLVNSILLCNLIIIRFVARITAVAYWPTWFVPHFSEILVE